VKSISGREVNKIRVLLADDSRIHTQLLSDALRQGLSLEVVNWDWDPSGLIPTALAQNVDILAISSVLHGHAADTFKVVQELRAVIPRTKVVVLLDSQKDEDVVNAFRAGARGIFNRESSVEMFCKCIHRVHEGEIWADRRGVSLAIDALASTPVVRAVGKGGLNLLSKRELQVVQCLVQGLSNREIADQMGLSQHTIKNYLFRIFDKLGVSSRTELLFMTLNQSITPENSFLAESKKAFENKNTDEATIAHLEKAAENGLPAAQLALAQLYAARRARPEDLVQAYKWYLIASEETSHARAAVTRMLTTKQIQEAQQKASGWLARLNQNPVSAEESTASNLKFG
jgi:DNA-binding NarL/FixJ family response regulator